MVVCVPVDPAGRIDPRWGRAHRVAVATLDGGQVRDWQEYEVGWDVAHDQGSEGGHHARIARFLIDHRVEAVVAGHMGEGMLEMLPRMGIHLDLGASGDARIAVESMAATSAATDG